MQRSALLLTVALMISACGDTSVASHPIPDQGGDRVVLAAPLPASRAPLPTRVPSIPLRRVFEQAWSAFAETGGVTLHHPSERVEMIGYHQSSHDGAQQLDPRTGTAPSITMASRLRDTDSRTAADMVVDPDEEIRSPVTGRVVRSGTYVLYCEYSDDFAVIEPDAHPGWEVKILHINGVSVSPGQQVQAGVTVLASGPTLLPFESQVDEHSAVGSWPHVHIEVIDPSIPDRPSGSGC